MRLRFLRLAGQYPENFKEPFMYGFNVELKEDFDAAVVRVIDALKKEGFGVLSDLDIQAAMKEKLGADIPRYRILGACNPPLALKALTADPNIGLLLPCNVVVREEAGGAVTVALVDPQAMMKLAGGPVVQEVADDAAARLRRVRDALAVSASVITPLRS